MGKIIDASVSVMSDVDSSQLCDVLSQCWSVHWSKAFLIRYLVVWAPCWFETLVQVCVSVSSEERPLTMSLCGAMSFSTKCSPTVQRYSDQTPHNGCVCLVN